MVKAGDLQRGEDARHSYLCPQCLVSILGEGCFPRWALTSLFCTAPDPERPLNKHSGLSEARGQQPGPEPGGQRATKRSGNSPLHPQARHTVGISPPPIIHSSANKYLPAGARSRCTNPSPRSESCRSSPQPASRTSSPRISSTPPPLPSCPNIWLLVFVSDYAAASFLLLSPPVLIC